MTDPAGANEIPPGITRRDGRGPSRARARYGDSARTGFTCLEIGRRFGISAQAVSIILARYRHRHDLLGNNAEVLALSSRAVNALSRIGVTTREGVRRDEVLVRLQGERSCGVKTFEEIRRGLERGG